MAKKQKPVVDDDDPKKAKKTESSRKLLVEARKRYEKCVENDETNRDNYREDMLFTYKPGEQWESAAKTDRGLDRPMYEFNETRVSVMSVVNHIRANRPSAKIRGVEEGDVEKAEVKQGLCMNICNNSDFESITDYAAGHQVAGGMGAWRIDTEYSDDTAFDQDIVIKPFINPLCVHADHTSKDELKRDAKYWFVHTKLPNEVFEEKYPNAEPIAFEPGDELEDDLDDEDSTWIAEYWKKVPIQKTVCLLSDGSTVDKSEGQTYPEGVTIVRERKINTHKIVQYIISGDAVLEGPNDWAGTEFPFVPVYGYYIIIDGKVYWGGLTRYAKDAQRALNWSMTSVFETIANTSQAKDWATPAQALGHLPAWAEANKKNFPWQLYNPDPLAPGPPPRKGGADVPVALVQASGMARDALKASLGIFNAALGQTSNETSGKAIRARQDEGMVATFNFGDNMSKSVRRTYEILLDLIPKIYDTERSIRILGKDGAEKFVRINSTDPLTGETINDMSEGKFDIVVTAGPSFATQRQEAAEFYTSFSQSNPAFATVAADLIIKSQDYPYADAMAERARLAMPPQIQAAISKEKPLPPEVQAAQQQVEQAMQMVQQQGQLVQQASMEAQTEKNAADKAKADVQVASANLKVQEAQLAQKVAEFKELIANESAKMVIQQTNDASQKTQENAIAERVELGNEVQQALVAIQTQAAQLMDAYAQQLAQIVVNKPPEKPKTKVARSKRVNGELVIQIEEHDGVNPPVIKQGKSQRNGDEMVTTLETVN